MGADGGRMMRRRWLPRSPPSKKAVGSTVGQNRAFLCGLTGFPSVLQPPLTLQVRLIGDYEKLSLSVSPLMNLRPARDLSSLTLY